MRALILVVTLLPLCACKDDHPGEETRLTQGVKKAYEPPRVEDGGLRVVVFNTEATTQLWAVPRGALQEVLLAVRTNRGEELARVLERYPAADARLVGHARAVMGRGPIAEPAELALVGPLSVPFGGVHQPLAWADAIPPSSVVTAGPECAQVLGRPGAVGQLLAGVGKSRAVFLIDEDELTRLSDCAAKLTLPADASEATRAANTRLNVLLRMGRSREAAVLMAMGS